jgi:DNA-binding NarL/FixJ family response regulator
VLRSGLRLLISGQSDIEVVAEAGDRASTVQLVSEMQPDIVLLDISMPGGGLKALEEVAAAHRGARVLVLTMHNDPVYIRAALAAGAAGYLAKHVADVELVSSIRAVHRGATVAWAASGADRAWFEAGARSGRSGSAGDILSGRERSVLQLLAQGYTNREIAERLSVSVKSVETYRARLARKLGLKTRAELVRYALETGLLAAGSPAVADQP